MRRSYYSNSVKAFLKDSVQSILGELARHHEFALEDLQKNAWIAQIEILQKNLMPYNGDAYIYFEFSIPRMGKRVDVILLIKGFIFVIEFKVGERGYPNNAIEQALDYSLDLKNFHEQSHHRRIVPIVVATEAPAIKNKLHVYDDLVSFPLKANKKNLLRVLLEAASISNEGEIDAAVWEASLYKPTPTIIEAAQALYRGHSVQEISRSDSGAINLSKTSDAIDKIIDGSKKENKKSICFITGVPGAGKTLAGLNIANIRHKFDENEHAIFLSGNGPLVQVLQEALARNEVKDSKNSQSRITKKAALSKTKAFIQNIHHFRDEAIQTAVSPIEGVVIFDEAQRAWTQEQTHSFMSRKKGISDFEMSEPDFLISVLDRHTDWAVIICLIGGGQEINTGEAGLPEWFSAIENKYPHWDVYVSDMLVDQEYTANEDLYSKIEDSKLHTQSELHLSVSVRSYRSERVSELVKRILDNRQDEAMTLWPEIQKDYPVCLTRNIATAKRWLRNKARGSERIGITASSGAYRLRPFGIHVKNSIDPKNWFLNDKEDVRSSYYLEEVATEFDIQGLELDWTCVAWDADFRIKKGAWDYKKFRGTAWQNVNNIIRRQYLKNAYRVLLTRARQGMILFIPEGDDNDMTRLCEFYDPTFSYLKEIGFPVFEESGLSGSGALEPDRDKI
jgi:hypothetical protein